MNDRDKYFTGNPGKIPQILAAGLSRRLTAKPDISDLRDKYYEASLMEIPPHRMPEYFLRFSVPVLDQGKDGSCTGFALATIANFLLRSRSVEPDTKRVSPCMFYTMAKRYDEWPGESYQGSSARGAMKGWYKHGVCRDEVWPCLGGVCDSKFTRERALDALECPLGAYFKVYKESLVDMHAALTEVGALFATARIHEGWSSVDPGGVIRKSSQYLGNHAFVIIGYDRDGFWIQNSWGVDWAKNGVAHIAYDDWLENGLDVWVARLGAPVSKNMVNEIFCAVPEKDAAYSINSLRPHIVKVADDGTLDPRREFGSTTEDIHILFNNHFKELTKTWKKKRLVIYAHGGLVSEESFIVKAKEARSVLLSQEIYPLFINWKTDLGTIFLRMMKDEFGSWIKAKELELVPRKLYPRLNDSLESVTRFVGRKIWSQIKKKAKRASSDPNGAAREVAKQIQILKKSIPDLEVHFIGHSAGAVLNAYFIQLLSTDGPIVRGPLEGENGLAVPVNTCALWAPACTIDLFKNTYLPLIESGAGAGIEHFALYTLDDATEMADSFNQFYTRSLLFLLSNAYEEKFRDRPCFDQEATGEPILGMQRYIDCDRALSKVLTKRSNVEWILCPDRQSQEPLSTAEHHTDFDDDCATIISSIKRILGQQSTGGSSGQIAS